MDTNEQAKFALVLDDQTSGPAQQAADRLERLRRSIENDRRELGALQRSMRDMKKAGNVSEGVLKSQQERIDALSKKLGKANEEYTNLGGNFQKRKIKPPLTKSAEGRFAKLKGLFSGIGEQAGAAGVPMGRLSGVTSRLSGVMGKGGLIGVALGVVAVFIAATAALTKYALGVASAHREEKLRLETLAHLRGRSKNAIADAEGMQAAIDNVADSTGDSREELVGYAEAAYRAGLRGKGLEAAIRGASARGGALGEKYGKGFVFMAAEAARAGKDIGKMADDSERRFGGLAERKAMSFSGLARRLSSNISSWFRGIKIDGLLESMNRFVGLFSKGNEVGRTWGDMLSGKIQDVVGWLTTAVDTMAGWVEKTTLYTLKAGNLWQSFLLQLRKGALSVADALEKLGISPEMLKKFGGYGKRLVDGMKFGVGGAALKLGVGLAKDVAKGFADFAGIRSPSKLFAGYGENISEGMEIGVEKGAPAAHRAVEGLVDVPSIVGGGTTNAPVVNATFNITGGDAEGIAETIRVKLSELLSGAAVQMGAA